MVFKSKIQLLSELNPSYGWYKPYTFGYTIGIEEVFQEVCTGHKIAPHFQSWSTTLMDTIQAVATRVMYSPQISQRRVVSNPSDHGQQQTRSTVSVSRTQNPPLSREEAVRQAMLRTG